MPGSKVTVYFGGRAHLLAGGGSEKRGRSQTALALVWATLGTNPLKEIILRHDRFDSVTIYQLLQNKGNDDDEESKPMVLMKVQHV